MKQQYQKTKTSESLTQYGKFFNKQDCLISCGFSLVLAFAFSDIEFTQALWQKAISPLLMGLLSYIIIDLWKKKRQWKNKKWKRTFMKWNTLVELTYLLINFFVIAFTYFFLLSVKMISSFLPFCEKILGFSFPPSLLCDIAFFGISFFLFTFCYAHVRRRYQKISRSNGRIQKSIFA